MEEFRPAYGIGSHYEVSNYGNIRRHVGGKGARVGRNFAKPRSGYHSVRICIDGTPRTVCVHRLVVETFMRPMEKGECVNHLDGDKLNNRLENLEITDTAGNARHAVDVLHWRPKKFAGGNNGNALLTEERARFIKHADLVPGMIERLAHEWGVKKSALYAVRAGRNWRHI